MTHQSVPPSSPAYGDAGDELARLRHVLALVEEMAGRPAGPASDAALDEAARISSLYAASLPILQRRFDRLAAETATWAGAGVRALLLLQERGRAPQAAAARLADALAKALNRLERNFQA